MEVGVLLVDDLGGLYAVQQCYSRLFVVVPLRELVEAAGFFELPEELAGPGGGADRFLYTLTVEMDGRRHTVRTAEAAAPAALRSLIRWLTNTARARRR